MITAQDVNDILKEIPVYPSGNRAAIYCNDGFNVSVQASQYHYCEPRISEARFYKSVELGFPSSPLPELEEWSEDSDCKGVFGYVPVEEVAKILESHGGIDFGMTLGAYIGRFIEYRNSRRKSE